MSWFTQMWGDQSDAFEDYGNRMNQLAQQTRQSAAPYDFYADYGRQGTQRYFDQASGLMDDPNALQNQVAQGFYESPYQSEMMNRVTQMMNANAANTGMLGSGRANQALQDNLLSMSGQFLNDYIDRGMNTYGQGFNAMSQFPNYGMRAQDSITNINNMANDYAQQGAGAQLQGDRSRASVWPNMFGTGMGAAAAYYTGGKSLYGRPTSSTQNVGY